MWPYPIDCLRQQVNQARACTLLRPLIDSLKQRQARAFGFPSAHPLEHVCAGRARSTMRERMRKPSGAPQTSPTVKLRSPAEGRGQARARAADDLAARVCASSAAFMRPPRRSL